MSTQTSRNWLSIADVNQIPRQLAQLLATRGVTDVICNGCNETFIDTGEGLQRVPDPFESATSFRAAIAAMAFAAGVRWDISQPFADFIIEGNRFHAVLGGNTGPTDLLSIRSHPEQLVRLDNLIELEMLSQQQAQRLKDIVVSGESFLVCGPTGSGKTTLLSALLAESKGRVIAVEDIAELKLLPPSLSLQVRKPNIEGIGLISASDLLAQALRMRPDRVVIGEIRGAEFKSLLEAVNNGHAGAAATIHAAAESKILDRLLTLGLVSGLNQQLTRTLLSSGIDWVVQLSRVSGVRKLSSISKFSDLANPLRQVA